MVQTTVYKRVQTEQVMTKTSKMPTKVAKQAINSDNFKKISNFICMFSDLCLYLHLKSGSPREKQWEKCVSAHEFPSFVVCFV